MAKIALRVYNHEIESLIEGGQVDEAIAHCQNVLKTFPMHVETYRLLGKSYLEMRRYHDAADIFLRVLQAVPDDFVSHVGMSIIRDDENKLDDAIWHMERAFEVQPSNPAIQGELRRLYGRRDGVEPPKIRLSRDALANMYAQGELFTQAITEIRSVLAEDPNRVDLQVMLARAHFRGGQKVEAAELAIQLLKKYPYCMDALRILIDVLPGTTRSEDTQTYRQRLSQLDPYAALVTGSVFNSHQVADAAITLEKLEYSPVNIPEASRGDWPSAISSAMSKDPRVEKTPEWLSAAASDESPQDASADSSSGMEKAQIPDWLSEAASEESQPVPGEEGQAKKTESEVPDWLREAGWQEASGETVGGDLGTTGGPEPPAEEAIAPAELPDWLKSMAPPEINDAIEKETPIEPAQASDRPDWMSDIKPESPSEPLDHAFPDESAPTGSSGATKRLSIEDDAMGWLESLAAKQGANPDELLTRPEDRPVEAPASLAQLGEEAMNPPEEAAIPENNITSLGEATLLEKESLEADLAGKDQVTFNPVEPHASNPVEGEIFAENTADNETVTGWLKNLNTPDGEAEPQAAVEEPTTDSIDELPILPDWLRDLEQPAGSGVSDTTEAGRTDLPDWLRSEDKYVPGEELSAEKRGDSTAGGEVPTPIAASEWIPAEETSLIAEPPISTDEPAQKPPIKTGNLAQIPEKDKDADLLAIAQATLKENKLDEAIQNYVKLIKRGRLLDEVIHDLREANYRFPVDIIVWQTLGDAYMRANRLQEALDAYTEAEKLLR